MNSKLFSFLVLIILMAMSVSARTCDERLQECITDIQLAGCRGAMTGDCKLAYVDCKHDYRVCKYGEEYTLELATGESAPASDMVLLSEISGKFYDEGFIDPHAGPGTTKLFSEIAKSDLDGQLTYMIYNGKAVIVIGNSLSEGASDFAKDLTALPQPSGVYPRQVDSWEVRSLDYAALFDVICPEVSCREISSECKGKEMVIVDECVYYNIEGGACIAYSNTSTKTVADDYCVLQELEKTCQGCIDELSCIPLGTRLAKEDAKYFCSTSKALSLQESTGVSCSFDYECITNNCLGGSCAPECSGCLTEGRTCVPFGGRILSSYCGNGGTLNQQKTDKLSCENNYECTSNICKEGRCKKLGLFRKIFGSK